MRLTPAEVLDEVSLTHEAALQYVVILSSNANVRFPESTRRGLLQKKECLKFQMLPSALAVKKKKSLV